MTKLYFHNATSGVSGTLPSSIQAALGASTFSSDAATVNRSMNTTIGTSQVIKSITATSGAQKMYFTRFVSDVLTNNTTISANTWNYAIAFREALLTTNWPISGTGNSNMTVYVWRPSNGTKIGTILDSSTGVSLTEPNAANTIKSNFNTFSGSAVTALAGDVICFELYVNPTLGGSAACDTYYDGTTETNNTNTTVSNHASYIETPQTIAFGPAPTILQTVYIEWEEA